MWPRLQYLSTLTTAFVFLSHAQSWVVPLSMINVNIESSKHCGDLPMRFVGRGDGEIVGALLLTAIGKNPTGGDGTGGDGTGGAGAIGATGDVGI